MGVSLLFASSLTRNISKPEPRAKFVLAGQKIQPYKMITRLDQGLGQVKDVLKSTVHLFPSAMQSDHVLMVLLAARGDEEERAHDSNF